MNDFKILDGSIIFEDMISGKMLSDFPYRNNNRTRTKLYYILDRIYPECSVFVSTVAELKTLKHCCFVAKQKGFRKDLERVLVILLSRRKPLEHHC